MTIARVVVDAPLAQPLEYALPEALQAAAQIGSCCVVPLGRRQVSGIVVALTHSATVDQARLRAVLRVVDEVAPLDANWLALTAFSGTYYQHCWGEVAVPALPPALRTPPGPRFLASLQRLRQREVGAGHAATDGAAQPAFALNAEQCTAVEAIDAAVGFAPHLLHGVTGSGKTEVYLEAAARRLARDPRAQVLLLVPEINLTPQFEARLRARFPHAGVAVLHSGLPAAERSAQWLAAHEGRARLVLGTRLAVFASLPQLALIVVDEEHDASFKAGDGVRYSARDLAIKRAQLARVPVVLGSATPAIETWAQAQRGRYVLLRLAARAGGGAQGQVQVRMIDTREDPPQQGLTQAVRTALQAALARGEQALVFINRRGYAPVIACEGCGWVSQCVRCSTFAAYHKGDGTLRCHHCGWQARVPRACPTCGNVDLRAVGHGTQRIEEALADVLPGARIARLDRDSTRKRHAARDALDAVHAGETDVLVGTQMIAKGHDFQRVTLVAVLNADAQLVAPDFRAPERLFATLLQVAGRAGRSGRASEVLVQTRYPTHPLLAALAAGDYVGFANQQLAERESAQLPPFVHQALLTTEARVMAHALGVLGAARDAAGDAGVVRLFDPVPMPLERLAGMHRAQLLVESRQRAALQAFLVGWLAQVARIAAEHRPRVRWQIEVDPQQI
ncbi:MAG: primosomal protein N' [Burkholderiales bacterium]|nr:primosomal protein N' [Burkholderiales bacterium]